MDVIDISSEDEGKEAEFVIGDDVTLEPLPKKRKLKPDLIVLTDEEDNFLEDSKDALNPESSKNDQSVPEEVNAEFLEEENAPEIKTIEDPIDLDEVADPILNGDTKTETEKVLEDLVDDDEDDEEDDSTKENVGQNSNAIEIVEASLPECSTSEAFYPELKQFIAVCLSNLKNADNLHLFEKKVDVLRHTLTRASIHGNSDEFKQEVNAATRKITDAPERTIQVFHDIYLILKSNYDERDDCKRLWKAYEKVTQRIKQLEVAEVDFDEEDDSAYIKLQRYKERATLIFKKISEREHMEPSYGRIYYSRLDYGCSERPEINRAINRKFQDRHKIPFPSYEDVHNCIRKCVLEHDMRLSKQEIEAESKFNFEKLGNLIQKRRKQDMASIHHDFLDTTVDPAKHDKELEQKLNDHRKLYQQKQNEIFDKFTALEATGNNNPELSEDSDDSHKEESEPELVDDEEVII